MALPVWAQRHGGGASGGGHFASRGGFAAHSSSSFHASNSFHGNAGFSRGSSIRIRTGNLNRRGLNGRRGFYSYYPYGYYPYGYYGWYNDPLAYDSSDQNEDQDVYAGAPYPYPSPASDSENTGLQRDVQALNGKIDRLQADVEARNRMKPEAEPETALVFRDQHVEEVRNYAISGGMLWVFNDQAAKRIPLSQLDLDATVKMNDDRGVDFQVPGPSLQLMIVR